MPREKDLDSVPFVEEKVGTEQEALGAADTAAPHPGGYFLSHWPLQYKLGKVFLPAGTPFHSPFCRVLRIAVKFFP